MSKSDIYYSTGSFRTSAPEAAESLILSGVENIELSGGKLIPQMNQRIIEIGPRANLQLHNYFPPADPPFVFNLASVSEDVRSRTLGCMLGALELSAAIGAPRYSFHAGFLVDPPVTFLGATWKKLERADPKQARELFLESVGILSKSAGDLGISLLVENNVLTLGTRDEGGDDVLLMASCEQIGELMEDMPEGVGLLMDVAHLKVTATTLNFNAVSAMRKLTPYIRGYHLSDNDGIVDSNSAVAPDSWFWNELSSEVPFATLEVAPLSTLDFRGQVDLVETLWMRREAI